MWDEPSSAGRRLLAWFDLHKRDLPWRRTRDPYRIWLSEVMLQQTRAEAVIPHYQRFLARFPSVDELAGAPLDDVLTLWSGLGYYRRARFLHAAACRMAATGGPPSTLEGWQHLPGVGPYTAAAVASIAFGIVVPVLDGNVERVMARRLGMTEDVKRTAARARLRAAAAELLDADRPGDSNQALMELGAVLCLPRRPRCPECPLERGCTAAAQGRQQDYPTRRPERRRETVRLVVAIVELDGRILLFRRPPGSSLLAGTWELPWVDLDRSTGAGAETAVRLAEKYDPGGGAAARPAWLLGPELAQVRHAITHRDLVVSVHGARLVTDTVAETSRESGWGWFAAAEVASLPTSSLVGKVLHAAARDV